MKHTAAVARYPTGLPLLADDIVEFHAARLLLLVHICGIKDRIDGMTKMAKLDFFVRYPQFFVRASGFGAHSSAARDVLQRLPTVEASMIRYHYGPWDLRYYDVLAYMAARGLLDVVPCGKQYRLQLTYLGKQAAGTLAADSAFADMATHMQRVKDVFGHMSGSKLKEFVYKVFDEEVAQLEKGRVITGGN